MGRLSLSLRTPPARFRPSQIQAVSSGFFWDPEQYDTSLQAIIEGNKKSALVVTAGTPSLISNNGFQQLRCPAGTYLTSVGSVAIGSTTQRWIAGWIRFTAASAGNNMLLAGQWGGSAAQTSALIFWDGTAISVLYGDGSAGARQWKFGGVAFPTSWTFIAASIDTTLSPDTTRAALSVGLVNQSATLTASGYTTVINTALPIQMCRQATSANANTTDLGPTYLLPAIPSAADQIRIMGFKPPA